ncbi:MAG: hypothetical protein LBB34_02215, partial [Holosporales bacterium]|jgi:hypothetical protein|nr:hypothetical protein [Holosporales bacterium]
MYSKIERGDRRAKREQISLLAKELQADPEELLILWLADQVVAVVGGDKELVDKVLDVTKKNIKV